MPAEANGADRSLKLKQLAEAQLRNGISTIEPLNKSKWQQWSVSMREMAYANDWPNFILNTDPSVRAPATDTLSEEDKIAVMVAYRLMKHALTDHPVADLVGGRLIGDARALYLEIQNWYTRKTTKGLQEAIKQFYNETMQSLDKNIIEWIRHIHDSADVLKSIHDQTISDDLIVSNMLTGLLPLFDIQRNEIEGIMDVNQKKPRLVQAKLLDYARRHNLEATKGSSSSDSKYNAFVAVEPKEQCRNWKLQRCTFGDNCKYLHDGPGACVRNSNQKRKGQEISPQAFFANSLPLSSPPSATTSSGSSSCAFCSEEGHNLHSCPKLAVDYRHDDGNVDSDPEYSFFTTSSTSSSQPSPSPKQMQSTTIGWFATIIAFLVFAFICCPAVIAKTTLNVVTKLSRSFYLPTTISMVIVGCLAYQILATPVCTASIPAVVYYGDGDDHTGKRSDFILDSGTNRFISNSTVGFLENTLVRETTKITTGGRDTPTSPFHATLLVQGTDGITLAFKKTLYLPQCPRNLVPAAPFVNAGGSVIFDSGGSIRVLDKNAKEIINGKESGGLYVTNIMPIPDPDTSNISSKAKDQTSATSLFGLKTGLTNNSKSNFMRRLLETHWCFGHLHMDKVRKLLGFPKGENPNCTACSMANSRKEKLSKNFQRATMCCERIHMDVGFTMDKACIFHLSLDDFSRVSYIEMLDSKADVLAKYKDLQTLLEKQHFPNKVKFIRTDSEGIYTTPAWTQHCKEYGINQQFSSRYRHDQNGDIERAMQTIGAGFRPTMIMACAPQEHVPDALDHVNLIRNNSPSKANNGRTPFEKQAGVKLPLDKRLARGPLFCLIFIHRYEDERRNAHQISRGVAGVYCGYDQPNNCYIVKEWKTGDRYFTADVTFHPNTFPYRSNPQRSETWLGHFDGMAPTTLVEQPDQLVNTVPILRQSERQREYTHSSGNRIQDIRDVNMEPAPSGNASQMHLANSSEPDPKTWEEAMESEHANEWIAAREKEKISFKFHQVYTLVRRDEVHGRILKSKAVFKKKLNPDGSVEKYKYRLTAKGYKGMLKQGIDYEESHSSTVRWDSQRTSIAIANHYDYDIALFDIVTFYLWSRLPKPVHMEQPEDWATEEFPAAEYVWEVGAAIYGLPQSGHCAQQKLKNNLETGKLNASTADDCIYSMGKPSYDKNKEFASVGTHVDDLLVTGTKTGIECVKNTIKKEFDITFQHNPEMVTGVEIERNRSARWTKLHQEHYILELLDKYNMTDCKSAATPIDPGMARALMLLPVDDVPDPKVLREYQSLVGEMRWLDKTRPDMLFINNLASRFLKNATQAHLNLIRGKPLRYLKGTANHGIVYLSNKQELELTGASDADLAGDLATSRSTSGYFTQLGQYGLIKASSKLEKKISTSTGQSETYAMQSLVKETIWDRHLLSTLGCEQKSPTTLLTDNNGVLKQSTKLINHTMAKHYRIAQAYIRSKASSNEVKLEFISTDDNPADIFTKALPPRKFLQFRDRLMGPQQNPGRVASSGGNRSNHTDGNPGNVTNDSNNSNGRGNNSNDSDVN